METLSLEYFDRDGYPISRQQWQHLSRQPGYTCVAHTESICNGEQITVITYWLGISQGQHPGTPLIFQTYGEIRRPGTPHARYYRTWSWPTQGVAANGHLAITDWMTTLLAEPAPLSLHQGTTQRQTAAAGGNAHTAKSPVRVRAAR